MMARHVAKDGTLVGRGYLAAIILFLLPAVSVELLTGNTSLVNFLNPVVFIVLTITYGGALLLIRETVLRWGKGFSSILVLAAGYGMVNEGLGTKGFFDPRFYAVVQSGLEGFGRWFGINVPWALSISIFHATFSIIVPLVIVSALFQEPGRWIDNRVYAALMVAFVSVIAFSFEVLSAVRHYHYNEGSGPLALVFSLLALDILIAWKLPKARPRRWQLRLPAPALFVFGALYAFAYFFSAHILRAAGSPVAFVAVDLGFFVGLPVCLLFKLPEPSSRGKVALVAGLLVPMLTVARGVGSGRVFAAIVVIALVVIALIRGGRSASEVAATP